VAFSANSTDIKSPGYWHSEICKATPDLHDSTNMTFRTRNDHCIMGMQISTNIYLQIYIFWSGEA